MNIPQNLKNGIEHELQKFDFSDVTTAREELTDRYRNKSTKKQTYITTQEQRCAYITARMPATFAVIHHVLEEVKERLNPAIKSLLDLGAGPGTAMWAAAAVFPEMNEIRLIEKDSELATIGKKLAAYSDHSSIGQAKWQLGDLEQVNEFHLHDLVILSYSIGELSPSSMLSTIQASWNAAQQFLVVIEPGTPVGFERIRSIRSHLISLGAFLVSPCPHANSCPMSGNDWCHFSQRIERSSLHRRIKEGVLNYEDEKFSYIIVSKTAVSLPQSRVLRHPMKRSGHINLELCTSQEGLKQVTISKKQGEEYKKAKKAEWGTWFN